MTKYQWDINKIRQLKQQSLEKKEIFNNSLLFNSYQDFCHTLLSFYRLDKCNSNNIYDEEDEYFDDDEIIDTNINTDGLNIIYELNPTIKNIKLKESTYLNQKIFMNNDELIELVRELVKLIPNKELKRSFDEYFNPKNHLVNIQYINYPIGVLGITRNDFINKICYASILRQNSLNDIIVTFHEFFHMYFRKNEPYNFFETPKMILGEVEGCFANLLINRLSNQLDIDKNLFLYSEYNEFNYIVHTLNTLNELTKKDSLFLSNFDINEMINDSISYLTALDLVYLYQKDPEKAFYRLSSITKLSGENIKKDLSKNDITFFEDKCKNLKKLYKTL